MAKTIDDRFKSLRIEPGKLFEPLQGYPEDLRQGITDYWKGKGVSVKLLEKYYNIHGSLAIKP